jgi:methyltransferase (TIGR00027 family)
MQPREPSRTALAVAAHRAAHQLLEDGRIFADPLAVPILGKPAEAVAADARANPSRAGMRFFVASRAAIAEAALRAGVEGRGVRQVVVLGAGLDTFGYRNPFAAVRVFEVDHPATQAWKQARLTQAGIATPPSMAFAPADFERDDLMASLAAAGFDPAQRTFFSWLGVVPYLTRDAIRATLGAIGSLPGGAEVAFDYSDPPDTLSDEVRAYQAQRAAAVAAMGEPFLTYFEPAELHAELRGLGLPEIADLGPRGLLERYVATRPAAEQPPNDAWRSRPDRGGHVLVARTA